MLVPPNHRKYRRCLGGILATVIFGAAVPNASAETNCFKVIQQPDVSPPNGEWCIDIRDGMMLAKDARGDFLWAAPIHQLQAIRVISPGKGALGSANKKGTVQLLIAGQQFEAEIERRKEFVNFIMKIINPRSTGKSS